jgi:hypothetical protein
MGSRAGLDAVVTRKIRSPCRDSNPRSSSPQLCAIPLSYPSSIIIALVMCVCVYMCMCKTCEPFVSLSASTVRPSGLFRFKINSETVSPLNIR